MYHLKVRYWALVAAASILIALYSVHVFYCQHSPLQFLDSAFANSDMHANLLWAQGIREQGWLNPHPYHPWNDWMQVVAPYPQWVEWWGGEQIFQQSPLYAYILSIFGEKLLLMRLFQVLLSIGTCVFLGLFTFRISGRLAGWIAYWIAALYAPFYAYSWPFLRDGIAWFIAAALLWAVSELTHTIWPSARALRLSWCVGMLLGLGFLARETYLLVIPIALAALMGFAWRRRNWGVVARVAIATILTVSPLLIRNLIVNAPLLSTSNRFAETFIYGNAGTARVYFLYFPDETKAILYQTHARPLPVVVATIASNPDGVRGWIRLQFLKLFTLFDPYESPDNLSVYFVATISPMVRLGVCYWMILPLALAGLFRSIWHLEQTHFWIWVFLPIFFLSLFVGIPLSRYRQSLSVFWIPLAAYFLVFLYDLVGRREFRKTLAYGVALLAGWALILGPLSRRPRQEYERPAEYLFSAQVYHELGEEQKAQAMLSLVRQKFPGALP